MAFFFLLAQRPIRTLPTDNHGRMERFLPKFKVTAPPCFGAEHAYQGKFYNWYPFVKLDQRYGQALPPTSSFGLSAPSASFDFTFDFTFDFALPYRSDPHSLVLSSLTLLEQEA